jgi:hypothetical protein
MSELRHDTDLICKECGILRYRLWARPTGREGVFVHEKEAVGECPHDDKTLLRKDVGTPAI